MRPFIIGDLRKEYPSICAREVAALFGPNGNARTRSVSFGATITA